MDNITKSQIQEAIRTRINSGLSYEQIEADFIAAGYSKEQINLLYMETTGGNNAVPSTIANTQSDKTPGRGSALIVSFLLVFVAALIFLGWFFRDNLVVFIESFSPRSELTLTVFDAWSGASSDRVSLGEVTKEQATRLCNIGSADTLCNWGEVDIERSSDYKGNFTAELISSDDYLKEDVQYEIVISNASENHNYRVFILHEDLLGRINGINEIVLDDVSTRDGTRIYLWDLSQVSGFLEQSETLPEGTYSIVATEAETGLVSAKSDWLRAKSINKLGSEENKKYAANTPLVESYWDGRGILVDGGPSLGDTVNPVGDMEMYDIFRGVDFPEDGEFNTVVLLQDGAAVIMLRNVDFVNFDNREFTIEELIDELEMNGGSIYRTKKFDAKKLKAENEEQAVENGEKAPVITPDNIGEFIANQNSGELSGSDSGDPALRLRGLSMPNILFEYNNIPPLTLVLSSVDKSGQKGFTLPFGQISDGGTGTLGFKPGWAGAYPPPGEYYMYGVGIDDRTMRIESDPMYLNFPAYPEATLQLIDSKGAVVAENNSLNFPLQGAIDRYYTSPNTELTLAWDVKNVDSCEISVPGSGLTLEPIREGIRKAGSMTVTTGSQYGGYVLNCLGNSYEQYGFPTEQRNDAEAVVKFTVIDPATDTMTLETLERALDGFDDWITDNGHPVIPINTVVREESVGAYNGYFIDRLYWCSGNCSSGARHNVIYRGVAENQCDSLNGNVLRNQGQYIGCSPLAN